VRVKNTKPRWLTLKPVSKLLFDFKKVMISPNLLGSIFQVNFSVIGRKLFALIRPAGKGRWKKRTPACNGSDKGCVWLQTTSPPAKAD